MRKCWIRVCAGCVERYGTQYTRQAIYGCRLEPLNPGDYDCWSCKTPTISKTVLCQEFFVCEIRQKNPKPQNVTHGLCDNCLQRALKKIGK